MTNQDDFDLLWPDPLSLTRYKWIYTETEAPNVVRCVSEHRSLASEGVLCYETNRQPTRAAAAAAGQRRGKSVPRVTGKGPRACKFRKHSAWPLRDPATGDHRWWLFQTRSRRRWCWVLMACSLPFASTGALGVVVEGGPARNPAS